MKPYQKTTFGAFCTVTTEKLPSGIYRHTILRHDMPGRISGEARQQTIYRKSSTPRADWVAIKRAETVAVGQCLVSTFRNAISNGEMTKEQASAIKMALRFKYGYGDREKTPLYTSREYQSDLCNQAARVTGLPVFMGHDALIYNP